MQEIQSIRDGVGRLFAGGERRLQPHHHQGLGFTVGHAYHALKCPRCDSINTKFCYYNNYNLSQPRYFCKACRRYWTKGGVLRNVPVGGGCRKTKRSNQKSGNVAVASTFKRKSSDSSNSNSDSSSLTPNTTTATSTPFTFTEDPPTLFSFQESSAKLYTAPPPVLEKCASSDNHEMLSEMGTYKSLLASSSEHVAVGFNPVPEISTFMPQQERVPEVGEMKQKSGMYDETGEVEEWEGGGDEGLFDQSYWSQIHQWSHHDHHLTYFP